MQRWSDMALLRQARGLRGEDTQEGEEEENTAFLKHIPYSMDAAALERLFEQVGGLKAVRLLRDRFTGASRVPPPLSLAFAPPQLHPGDLHARHRRCDAVADETQRDDRMYIFYALFCLGADCLVCLG